MWVVGDVGWNEGALAALWASEIFVREGMAVTIQPIRPPTGSTLPWPNGVELYAPPRRALSRTLRTNLSGFDRIIVDQDFTTEILGLSAITGVAGGYLYARQAGCPRDFNLSSYAQYDGVLAASRAAYRTLTADSRLLTSRLWQLPLLADWQAPISGRWPFGDQDGAVVATAGVMDAVKGLDLICNALSLMSDRGRRMSLLILGNGPEVERVRAYAKSLGVRVEIMSQDRQWSEWIRRSDVLLSLGLRDGLMADIDAAVAVGTPVVAIDLPTARERANLDGTAWLAHPTVMAVVEQLEQGIERHQAASISLQVRRDAWFEALRL